MVGRSHDYPCGDSLPGRREDTIRGGRHPTARRLRAKRWRLLARLRAEKTRLAELGEFAPREPDYDE